MNNSHKWATRCLSFILCLILWPLWPGCTTHKPRAPELSGMDKLDPSAIIAKEKHTAPLGLPPFSEKLEPVIHVPGGKTKLYSFVFNAAPIAEFLKALTQDLDLNLTIEPGVDPDQPVTVSLKQVSYEEALNMIVRNSAGLAWRIESNTLFISRFEERIYQFDYIDISGDTTIKAGGDMLGAGAGDTGVSGQFEIKTKRSPENTDVWKAIQDTLSNMKSPDGNIRINRFSGVIYMKDMPDKILSMIRFLETLSESLHRQVFIEAKIIEVGLDENNQSGIDWSKLGIEFKSGGSSLDNLGITLNSGSVIRTSDQKSLYAVVDFLKTQGDVSVLSNPHLSLMNGQSAVLTVGYQFPYGNISGISRDNETGVVTIDAEINRTVLGLQLGITAQISSDGMVILNIIPTITRIQGEEKVELPTSSSTVQAISNPIIDLQELATTVRVREGNSVVLAGLISKTKNISHEGLPFFLKLPLIGHWFRHEEEKLQNKELVILITPHITKEG